MYLLKNNKTEKFLSHPRLGKYNFHSLEEAEKMLVACQEYLKATNNINLIPDIVIHEIN